eukprot:scpid97572/ scgid9397/ 
MVTTRAITVSGMPYGETEVVKDECIGHVQKRVGKGLRDLKQRLGSNPLSDASKPLSGRGRLTEKYMDRLQTYYGKVIRSNIGDLQGMYKAIWASVCHRCTVLLQMTIQCISIVLLAKTLGVDGRSSKLEWPWSSITPILYRKPYWMPFDRCIFALLTVTY